MPVAEGRTADAGRLTEWRATEELVGGTLSMPARFFFDLLPFLPVGVVDWSTVTAPTVLRAVLRFGVSRACVLFLRRSFSSLDAVVVLAMAAGEEVLIGLMDLCRRLRLRCSGVSSAPLTLDMKSPEAKE